MDAETSILAGAIGTRVRAERARRNWTQDQLAESAGVSRRMVITVEQGSVNPSVGTLLRLSDALGVGLPALLERPETPAHRITRAGAGAVLWQGPGGGEGVLVGGTAPPSVLELWVWSLGPGDLYETGAHMAGTREALHVTQGTVAVGLGPEIVTLSAGDSLTFDGDIAHSYRNPGNKHSRFTLAVSEPGVGSMRSDPGRSTELASTCS